MKQVALLIFCLALAYPSISQRKSNNNENSLKGVPFKERIITGGGMGLGFGSNQDFISLSPMIGYKITEKFLGGTSVTYRYTKYKYYSPAIKLIDYGVNPFLRYTIYENIFAQTEFEYLNYEFPEYDDLGKLTTTRKTFNSFLAGGGFMQPIGDKAVFFVMALYNFSYVEPKYGEYSPYYSPFILRAGINIGF